MISECPSALGSLLTLVNFFHKAQNGWFLERGTPYLHFSRERAPFAQQADMLARLATVSQASLPTFSADRVA